MLKANIETFLACDASYEKAGIVLYGAPFDSTTSYRPGTRFGSRAIRSESYGLESYSPYQDRDLTDYAVFDAGDQELCFGDASLALKDLRERAAEIAGDGKIPFMLGGEHLVTLAPVQALAEKYPDLHIIHFDAHTDLIIWARNFRTPVCCAAAGRFWEMAGSRSLVSAPATGRNGAGEKNT
jgi:agmatinase